MTAEARQLPMTLIVVRTMSTSSSMPRRMAPPSRGRLNWVSVPARMKKAKRMLKMTTWRISSSAAAWKKLWGKMWTRTSASSCGLAAS
jgi:hypothetical protein